MDSRGTTAITFQNRLSDATCEKLHTPLCSATAIAAESYVSSCYVARFSCTGNDVSATPFRSFLSFDRYTQANGVLQRYIERCFPSCKIDIDSFSSQFNSTPYLPSVPVTTRVPTFNNFNWDSGYLRLNNISCNGTGVTAPSGKNRYQLLRPKHQLVLLPNEQTRISVGALQFDISFPDRSGHRSQIYNMKFQEFRARCLLTPPPSHTPGFQADLQADHMPNITAYCLRQENCHNVYLFHEKIGEGSFGTVRKALDQRTGELFAAKQFTKSKPAQVAKEIALSRMVSHKHIVSFVDQFEDDKELWLIVEYLPMGNLMQVHVQKAISFEETRTVLFQTLQALAYLHDEMNITHRDIKPENILVRSRTPELFIKLCDFGLSTDELVLKTNCGTDLYTAAEISRGSYSNAVDIWAIGVLGLEFIKGLPNFNRRTTPQGWCKKIRLKIDFESKHADDAVMPLLKQMLQLRPQDRPSAKACLSDPSMISQSPLATEKVGRDLGCLEADGRISAATSKRKTPPSVIFSNKTNKKARRTPPDNP
ncbi:hypothetical protein MMC07_001685 [Pseudocyphellaria aurata]|nr:hypothetical protein [Pseudocyphellaria aurata]